MPEFHPATFSDLNINKLVNTVLSYTSEPQNDPLVSCLCIWTVWHRCSVPDYVRVCSAVGLFWLCVSHWGSFSLWMPPLITLFDYITLSGHPSVSVLSVLSMKPPSLCLLCLCGLFMAAMLHIHKPKLKISLTVSPPPLCLLSEWLTAGCSRPISSEMESILWTAHTILSTPWETN